MGGLYWLVWLVRSQSTCLASSRGGVTTQVGHTKVAGEKKKKELTLNLISAILKCSANYLRSDLVPNRVLEAGDKL